MDYIDKIAFIHIKNRKFLTTKSKGKDVWYIPGGKREQGETDEEALIREIHEELSVVIIPETIRQYGTFEAQAHGKSEGTIVRMSCYEAQFKGILKESSEIEVFDFKTYSAKNISSPVDKLIIEELKKDNLID